MKELVFLDGKEIYTDTLVVAKVFNKKHKNVLRDVERILLNLDGQIDRLKFEPIFYQDSYSREQKKYMLCKDALMLLIMGYGGSKALSIKLEYIKAFNMMHDFIVNQLSMQDKLFEAIKKEEISFSNASQCGKGLNRRKQEKPILTETIDNLKREIQIDWTEELKIY